MAFGMVLPLFCFVLFCSCSCLLFSSESGRDSLFCAPFVALSGNALITIDTPGRGKIRFGCVCDLSFVRIPPTIFSGSGVILSGVYGENLLSVSCQSSFLLVNNTVAPSCPAMPLSRVSVAPSVSLGYPNLCVSSCGHFVILFEGTDVRSKVSVLFVIWSDGRIVKFPLPFFRFGPRGSFALFSNGLPRVFCREIFYSRSPVPSDPLSLWSFAARHVALMTLSVASLTTLMSVFNLVKINSFSIYTIALFQASDIWLLRSSKASSSCGSPSISSSSRPLLSCPAPSLLVSCLSLEAVCCIIIRVV